MKKRITSLLLVLAIILSLAPVTVRGVSTGSCGENAVWHLDSDGCLTISGSGEMENFLSYNSAPWYSECESIRKLVISPGISTIGDYAFYDCTQLQEVVWNSDLISIGRSSFSYCSALETVSLPDALCRIGRSAFTNCTGLKHVLLPSALESIGRGAFAGCESLRDIHIPSGITYLEPFVFSGCTSLASVSLPERLTHILDHAFAWCAVLSEISLPGSLRDISVSAFSYSGLTEIVIPDSVTSIGSYAFHGCSQLKYAKLPSRLERLNDRVFQGCVSLERIVIPDGCTYIFDRVFSGCISLKQVYIPSTVYYIGEYAFDCDILAHVFYGGSEEQWGRLNIHSSNQYYFSRASFHYNSTVAEFELFGNIPDAAMLYNGSYYNIYLRKGYTWSEAKAYCEALGGHLATITDPGEQMFIELMNDQKDHLWIGGYRDSSYNWYWVTGEPWSYANWAEGEPNNSSNVVSNENRIAIWPDAWNDLDEENLSEQCGFICEWDVGSKSNGMNLYMDGEPVVYVGEEIYLRLSIQYADDIDAAGINWSISDENIARGEQEGALNMLGTIYDSMCLTGLTPGQVTVTAYSPDGRTAQLTLTVQDPPEGTEPPAQDSYYGTTIQKLTDNELLEFYIEKWYEAYAEYATAAGKIMEKNAKSEGQQRESVIRAQAEMMQQNDAVSNSKYLNFTYSFPEQYKEQAYYAYAEVLYDYVISNPDFDSIDLSKNTSAIKLANTILKSMANTIVTKTYGDMVYNIRIFQYGNLGLGELTCYSSRKHNPVTYRAEIVSTVTECATAIRAFRDELTKLGLNSAYNIFSAVQKDLLGVTLSDLTEAYMSGVIKRYASNFSGTPVAQILMDAGIGDLFTTLNTCHNYYIQISQIPYSTTDELEQMLFLLQGYQFSDPSISDKAAAKAMEKLEKASAALEQACIDYLNGTLPEKGPAVWWRMIWACPVSVLVYAPDGTQVGYAGEDGIWYTDSIITITESGDAKIIESHVDAPLSFLVAATDYGTLGCSIETYSSRQAPLGRLNYYGIPLEPDQYLTLDLPVDLCISEEPPAIYSGGEEILPDEYISVDQSAGVFVSCTPESDEGAYGGSVGGAGYYVRGDAVVLTAIPDEGYCFAGWYQGDSLMYTSPVYEFFATEDTNLRACFSRDDPVEEDIASGTCGENACWLLDSLGRVIIFGEGPMEEFPYSSLGSLQSPWGEYANQICSAIISNGVTTIGSAAFARCRNLTDIRLPDTITRIGGYAFVGCSKLTNVELPQNLTTICDCAFSSCEQLREVTIPASVSSIGISSFKYCDNLMNIHFEGNASDPALRIESSAFSSNNFTQITLPENLAYLGDYVFRTCDHLESIFFSGSAPEFGEYALWALELTIYYPAGDPSWDPYVNTAPSRITWIPYRCNPFTDVPEDSWYYESVLWAVRNGITNGTSETTFSPNAPCMRAQVVTFLWRSVGCPEPVSADNPFVDVKGTDFFYKAVLWAAEEGITTGTDANHFSPYAVCNRAQVVTFLHRTAGKPEAASADHPFDDVKPSDFYYDAMLWAVENGITNGMTATTFGPSANCNRAQIVTFLYRTFCAG